MDDISAGGASFLDFANVADRVGATSKRLEKSALLGQYFATLSDDDLALASRYLAGAVFPQRDQRTISVGGSTLFGAICLVSGSDGSALAARSVQLGDLGDVAHEAFATAESTNNITPTLTLAAVGRAFEKLAATSGSKRKGELVAELLSEATPSEAKYVVKLLLSDLRIGLREGAVEDAIARLAEVPVGEVQWANMLTGDIGETALLARRKKLSQARMRLFHPLRFMLATPATHLLDIQRQMPVAFTVEDKFDGIRAQAHIACSREVVEAAVDSSGAPLLLHGVTSEAGCRVALFSRTLDEITHSFPELVEPLAALLNSPQAGDGLVLDGEIVPVQGGQIIAFQELQKRLGRKKPTPEVLAQIPVAFVAYDVLYGGSRITLNEPFAERRALLEALPMVGAEQPGSARRANSSVFSDVAALDTEFDAARARGNEGLMIKDPASPYKPGRRGRDWLKLKRALATLDVVVTAVEVGNGRRSHLLSDYTFAVRASEDNPTLLNVGKAYSGLTDAELAAMSEWFKQHTLQEFAHGRVRVVEPTVVIEVTFDRVQASTRHKSGYALRFPRIVRLRPDKPVEQIDTLAAVRALTVEDAEV